MPILPEDKSSWNGCISASGVIRHGNEQLVIVLVLVGDDDAHCPRLLGPNHLGHKAALSPLDQGDVTLDHVRVGDVTTPTAGLGGDQLDVSTQSTWGSFQYIYYI